MCCPHILYAQAKYSNNGNNSIKYRYDYASTIAHLNNGIEEYDSLDFLSMKEYCLLNSRKFDSLALDLEKKLNYLEQAKYNGQLNSILENNEGASSDVNSKLEFILNRNENDVYSLSDILRRVSAAFKYFERTQNKFGFLPIRNKYDAYVFDQKQQKHSKGKFFNQTKFSVSPENLDYSIFSEVYTDYFGVVKFSIGSVITTGQINENNDQAEIDSVRVVPHSNSINRLTGGGGNLVINLNYPICMYVNDRSNFKFSCTLQNRLAFDIPLNQTNLKGYPINVEPSLLNAIYFGGMNNVLALTLEFKIARVFGNGLFYDLLAKEDKQSFFLHQLSLGIQINKKFNVNMNLFIGSQYVKEHFPGALSIGLLF
jgi:hypothetical protein